MLHNLLFSKNPNKINDSKVTLSPLSKAEGIFGNAKTEKENAKRRNLKNKREAKLASLLEKLGIEKEEETL